MNTKVHWNRHKKLLSVKTSGQPRRYLSCLALSNCRMIISRSGHQRCLKEGVRNVHAWIVGEEVPIVFNGENRISLLGYNPFFTNYFYDINTLAKIDSCSLCHFSKTGFVFYWP